MKRFTRAEDQLLIDMVGTIGQRWSKIVRAFDQRSIPSIRNRWLRIQKSHCALNSKRLAEIYRAPKLGYVREAEFRSRCAGGQGETSEKTAEHPLLTSERLNADVETDWVCCVERESDRVEDDSSHENADVALPVTPITSTRSPSTLEFADDDFEIECARLSEHIIVSYDLSGESISMCPLLFASGEQ